MDITSDQFERQLSWIPISPGFEIRDGKEIIASMQMKGPFGSSGTLQYRDRSWTYKRVGFFKNSIQVCDLENDVQAAIFEKIAFNSNGMITTARGTQYKVIRNADLSRYQVALEGRCILEYQMQEEKKRDYFVNLATGSAEMDEFPVLLVLTGCVVMLQHIDTKYSAPTYV